MTGLRNQLEWCTKAQAIMGVVLAMLIGLFYVCALRPNSIRKADLQMEINSKRRQLNDNNVQVAVLPALIQAVDELESRLEKYDKQLPRQQELDRFIKDINAMVNNSSLRRVEVKPAVMPIRSPLFAEQPVQLKFEGDFLSVFSFLRQTEEMQRLTRVKELKLRNSDRSGKSGQVEVELSMNIYFSAEDN